MATFTVIITLVKHSDDVHWNEYIVTEEIAYHLSRSLKMIKPVVTLFIIKQECFRENFPKFSEQIFFT